VTDQEGHHGDPHRQPGAQPNSERGEHPPVQQGIAPERHRRATTPAVTKPAGRAAGRRRRETARQAAAATRTPRRHRREQHTVQDPPRHKVVPVFGARRRTSRVPRRQARGWLQRTVLRHLPRGSPTGFAAMCRSVAGAQGVYRRSAGDGQQVAHVVDAAGHPGGVDHRVMLGPITDVAVERNRVPAGVHGDVAVV
jgi:hypothetical protein